MYISFVLKSYEPGLGELLRHLCDLVDSSAEEIYCAEGLKYRPRYTPIMRCLGRDSSTITDITAAIYITQGAVSQTVKLMETDGLIRRTGAVDTRSSLLCLTDEGLELLTRLELHWSHMFTAIEQFEDEIGHPFRAVLENSIQALELKDFATRITNAKGRHRINHD